MPSVIERILKGGSGFFAANLITKGLGFLFIVIASRILGPAEFGVLALSISVFGVARKLATFGLPHTIQRFLSGEDGAENVRQIYGSILFLGVGVGLIASVALYTLAPYLAGTLFEEPRLRVPLRILAPGTLAALGFALYRAVLQAQEQIGGIVRVDSARSAAKILLLVGLFTLWSQSAVDGILAVAGSFLIGALFAWWEVQKLDVSPDFSEMRSYLGKVVSYSGPLVVVGFSYFIAQQADRLMLGWLSGAKEVGIYTATSTLAMIMSTLHASLISIFMPIASDAYRRGVASELRKSYLFISRWMGLINGMALLVFAGGGMWLLTLFGTEYVSQTTYIVLVILSTLYFIGTWVGPTGALLEMADGHRLELLNTVLFVSLNLVLNYILILRWGVIGATLATFISGVARNLLQLVEIQYHYGINPVGRRNLVVLLLTIGGTTLLFFIPHGVARTVITVPVVGVLATYAFWSAKREEREEVCGLLRQYTAA